MSGYSLLAGIRVLEVAQLAPSSVGGHLAALVMGAAGVAAAEGGDFRGEDSVGAGMKPAVFEVDEVSGDLVLGPDHPPVGFVAGEVLGWDVSVEAPEFLGGS